MKPFKKLIESIDRVLKEKTLTVDSKEEVDEVSKGLLNRYSRSATQDKRNTQFNDYGKAEGPEQDRLRKKIARRGKGIATAKSKLKSGEYSEELEEVLLATDPIEKWIHDFIDSDAPQFEGKTRQERIKMALGAYYAKQKEG